MIVYPFLFLRGYPLNRSPFIAFLGIFRYKVAVFMLTF